MVRAETQKTECTSYALQRNKNLSAYQNTLHIIKFRFKKFIHSSKYWGKH